MFKKLRKRPSRLTLFILTVAAASVLVPSVSGEVPSRVPKDLEKTIVVSPVAGSPRASGKALLSALKARHLSTKSGHWVVRLEPGVYDLGSSALRMHPEVDVEGAGIEETEIVGLGQSFGGTDFSFNRGVVVGADAAALRHLTVRCVNTPERDACITMANYRAAPRLENVRLLAVEAEGAHWGMRNNESSPQLEGVEIVVANGVSNYGMVNVQRESRPEIRHSTLTAADGVSDNVGILNKLEGLPLRLSNVEIAAMNGHRAIGIRTLEPGDFAATSVKGLAMSSMRLVDVEIAALGASRNIGLWQGMYTLEMRHSRVVSDDSAIDFGTFGNVDVAASELHGSEYLARGRNVRIAGSVLLGRGDVLGYAEEHCVGVRTESGSRDSCP